ncbi:MAG: trypsin-like peptidase domain-containing protein [Methanomassiliicoccaceae archaeon]|nr:trypsin-like peptidase domain-containing protein [Methanomassiliicoccaceae archaeon]
MFGDACEKAMRFTRPVITSTREYDGTVKCSCGAFIVLNDDGWILTAGHIFDSFVAHKEHGKKIKEIEEQNSHKGISDRNRPKLKIDPSWLTNHSFWWGWDGVRLNEVFVDRKIDIAVGRLQPFDRKWITEYPTIKDPLKMRPGTSLCKLGFPFSQINATFDEKANNFRLADKTLPLPLFPLEGMHTRNIMHGKSMDNTIDILYVETSSPGLRGQSGGPIFDKDCNICGIQLRTNHMPLDFKAEATVDGRKVVENQFLNLGVGLHAKTIVDVLRKRNIEFTMEGDSGYRIIS